jgi:hypothetical protein
VSEMSCFFFYLNLTVVFFSLKKQYRAANARIGKTGAGLELKDVKEGSELRNLIRALPFFLVFVLACS